jgi:hypothetical protein
VIDDMNNQLDTLTVHLNNDGLPSKYILVTNSQKSHVRAVLADLVHEQFLDVEYCNFGEEHNGYRHTHELVAAKARRRCEDAGVEILHELRDSISGIINDECLPNKHLIRSLFELLLLIQLNNAAGNVLWNGAAFQLGLNELRCTELRRLLLQKKLNQHRHDV